MKRDERRLLRVGCWNMGHASWARVLLDLHRLARRCDVLTLAEAGDRRGVLTAFLLTRPWWAMYRPTDLPGQASTPILYRRGRCPLVAADSRVAVEPREVGPRGAGPSRIKAKFNNRVSIRHRPTGQRVTIISVHTIASATRHDLPPAERIARCQHYADHVASLLELLEQRPGPAVVSGDFNAPAGFGLLGPLGAAGLIGWSTMPTHGTRSIDHVLHRRTTGTSQLGREYVETSSDHRAVVATFRLGAS